MIKINSIKLKSEKLVKLTKGVVDNKTYSQIAIVHHSDSIEGSTLTEGDTFLLLEQGLTPANKPIEHTDMAIDHFNAVKYIYQLAINKTPLDKHIVQKISSLLLTRTGSIISNVLGTWDETKGEFRKGTVRAGVTTFPAYNKIEKMVTELCNYINKTITKTDYETIQNLAFDAHFNMVSIHPFSDGNGRLSRLIMNYIQFYHNIPPSVVFKEDKSKYYEVLVETRKLENIKIFRTFMYNQTDKYLTKQINDITQKKGKGFTMFF